MQSAIPNTEPFFRYHEFHNRFNRLLKVTNGALEQGRLTAVGCKEGDIPTLPPGNEPFGEQIRGRDIPHVAVSAIRFLAQMGIVRVFSAFEDCLTGFEAESLRARVLRKHHAATPPNTDSSSNLVTVSGRLGWDLTPLTRILPLFEFFTLVRNCVVHRNGRVSPALLSFATSGELLTANASWFRRNAPPLLPDLKLGQDIPVLPRHAIFASAVCYRIAQHLNSILLAEIGESGLVHMAAYHTLLSDERLASNAKHSADRVVNTALFSRYRVKSVSTKRVVETLKEIGQWEKCQKRFKEIYTN